MSQSGGKAPEYKYQGSDWYVISTIMNYAGVLSVDQIAAKYFQGTSAMNTADTCTGQNLGNPITAASFKSAIQDTSNQDFTFAVEMGTCTPGVEVIQTDTACDKSCGCGKFTRSFTCKYSGVNGTVVPTDSDDYKCCATKPDEVRACNMQCCPQWYKCDKSDTTNCKINPTIAEDAVPATKPSLDTYYSKQVNAYDYLACGVSCGSDDHTVPAHKSPKEYAELRCFCRNTCAALYPSTVIKDGAQPAANSITRHSTDTCMKVNVTSTTTIVETRNEEGTTTVGSSIKR